MMPLASEHVRCILIVFSKLVYLNIAVAVCHTRLFVIIVMLQWFDFSLIHWLFEAIMYTTKMRTGQLSD